MNNNVYLVPWSNGTYVPYIEETAPCEKAVLLTQEGDYPASILSAPFDACDFDDAYEDTVQNRSELLQALLLNGQMGNVIVKLWDHSVHNICSIDICNLFDDVYHTRMDAIRGNGNINSKFAFVDSVSLDEYCTRWCPKRDCAESFIEIR